MNWAFGKKEKKGRQLWKLFSLSTEGIETRTPLEFAAAARGEGRGPAASLIDVKVFANHVEFRFTS